MTLQEISSWLNQSLRFKLSEAQIILLLNETHKLACDQNILRFMYWDNFLTTFQELTFIEAGYVSSGAGGIGLPLVGLTSGAQGVAVSFDNDLRVWTVETSDQFEAGETIDLIGSGAGGVLETDGVFQQGSLGPYDWPTSPPVRHMNGLSNVTDGQIFGQSTDFILPEGSGNSSPLTRDDYGLIFSQTSGRNFYLPSRVDEFARTITLINRPGPGVNPRWVYFRSPEVITDLILDNPKVLIPDTYHMNWIQCLIEAAQVTTKNQIFTREHVEGHFAEWWETMKENYNPNGKNSNQTNEGTI